ncbi:ATP synthase mitochondrial F1 complex assembly factor 2 homolog l(2)k14505 isoform X2 [Calliopsis andreniformis]|uniref:ATP synthase mitochondrial F1 complex assembly factor 2 homolog l(2)k14505 isoform X2 n=1 Tax=Calliopsis andreniformis TaxID=337506 RepID=UPI003FCCE32B
MHYFKYKRFATAFSIVRNMATVKRFYRKANILSSSGKFEITLDQRKLKTPQGKIFEVDSKPLALAIAAEWDSQKEVIDRSNMHLESDELYKLQTENWDPLVQWFCDNYSVNLTKTKSIETPTVPIETKAVLIRHLMSYNCSAVHGFMYGVDAIKSVILTLAAAERVISIQEAVKLSRLEEDFQASHWGSVEWFHDQNKYDLQARLAAAILFVHLNSYSVTYRPKSNIGNMG